MKYDQELADIAAKGPMHERMVRIRHELMELEREFQERGDAATAREVRKHQVALWMLGNRIQDG